ncbi:MAG: hypothetical protein BMS9Abin18_1358 [Zetaproteobacteria bacterium]|nr:MAG: hypothetical protein BMS9Abin18_1358 [Zetaproteobacteria bacterium]
MNTIINAVRTVLGIRYYQWIAGIGFPVFLVLYLITLPASYTGGYSSFAALKYLTPTLVGFSVLMAALVALLIPLVVYLIKQGRKSSKSSATGGLLVGFLTPILCCSPILPIVISFIASLLPMLGGAFGVRIQGFIATHQIELFITASLLLLFALYQNAKKVINGVQCGV